MKAFLFLLFTWATLHAATSNALAPNLTVGQYGSGALEFRHPGNLQAHAGILYVVDEGNDRIQKVSDEGTYLSETHTNLAGIQDICLDVAGMVYVSSHDGDDIVQLRGRDFVPLAAHALSSGHIAHSSGGALVVLSRQEMRLQQYSFSVNRIREWELPAEAVLLRPLDLVSHKDRVWVLTQSRLLEFDSFGILREQIPYPHNAKSGFACVMPSHELLLILENDCYLVTRAREMVPAGTLNSDIRIGGVAIIGSQFWVSDRNHHRLLRFVLPEAKLPQSRNFPAADSGSSDREE